MLRMTLREWQRRLVPESEIIGSRIKKVHAFVRDLGEFTEWERLPDRDALLISHKNDGGTKYESWIFEEIAARPEHRYVIALVNTDGPFSFAGPISSNVLGVFTCNRVASDPRVVSVPLGVQDAKVPALHRIQTRHKGGERPILAYLNFTYNAEPHYNRERRISRAGVIRHFEPFDWARCEIRAVRRETPRQQIAYYEQLAQSRFCVSPEGNGIDTYRTWEALYLGAVPIVVDSAHMRSFSDLPIVYTENYEEFTRDMLEARYAELLDREFDFTAVLRSAHAERVRSLVASLDDPAFALYSPNYLAEWGKYYR